MTEHETHGSHAHEHGAQCGHAAIAHDDHTDYLHDGHLHHPHGDHVDEHVVDLSMENPRACTPTHACGDHDVAHAHSDSCEHEPVPHGDHVDFLIEGHLHRPHGDHCDDHGVLAAV